MTRVVWFRNDLRLTDHPALADYATEGGGDAGPRGVSADLRAAALAPAPGPVRRGSDRLLPVFIFPPRFFTQTSFGFAKTGPHRAQFLIATVESLQRALQRRGSDLVVAQGSPARVLAALTHEFDVDEIWYQEEIGTEEAAEIAELEKEIAGLVERTGTPRPSAATAGTVGNGIRRDFGPRLRPHHGQTLYHPDDLPFAIDDMPLVYTEFRRAVEAEVFPRSPSAAPDYLPPLPRPIIEINRTLREHVDGTGAYRSGSVQIGTPTVELLSGSPAPIADPRGAIRFTGGEGAAWERLHAYFWEGDLLRGYKHTRNGLLGADYSSKFSPWLANGSISPRSVVAEVHRYEEERVKNSSTRGLVAELIWRDYFACLLRKFGSAMFRFEGPFNRHYRWSDNWKRFTAWREGTTGQDFIDANMREIATTGYMSNRGRQNVASYLSRDLKVNWIMGAEYFESQLIDYDPASNYGNWTYTVGVGTDPRRDRYFNQEVQAAKYDPNARYRLHWLQRGPRSCI